MARSSRLVIALSCLETNQTQSRLSSPEKHMLRDEDRTDGLSTSGRELRRALTAGELPCNVWRGRAYEREEKRTETSERTFTCERL